MRFGLILGRLAILKKKVWADYEQLLRAVFLCFHSSKMFFFAHENMKKPLSLIIGPIFFSVLPTGPKPAQISNIFHRNLPPRDFSIMTLVEIFMIEKSGVGKSGVGKFMVEEFMFEKSGVERSGVEKSGVEMSGVEKFMV